MKAKIQYVEGQSTSLHKWWALSIDGKHWYSERLVTVIGVPVCDTKLYISKHWFSDKSAADAHCDELNKLADA